MKILKPYFDVLVSKLFLLHELQMLVSAMISPQLEKICVPMWFQNAALI